jgi:hypothetical protein
MPCEEVRLLEKSTTAALRVLLASAMLLLASLAALAENTTNHPGFAGIYLSRLAKTAPSMGVSLGEDGTATVTEDPGKGSTTEIKLRVRSTRTKMRRRNHPWFSSPPTMDCRQSPGTIRIGAT